MKKLISVFYVFALFLLIMPYALYGQSKKDQKLEAAIIGLKETTFSIELLKQKEIIEQNIASFLELKEDLSKSDIDFIETRYTETQEELDILLDDLRDDITDPKSQKEIFNTPDQFTLRYQDHLEEIILNYQNNCQSEMDALYPQGASIIGDISSLIRDIGEIFNFFKDHRKTFIKMSDEYFEENFAKELRLNTWEEFRP